MPAALLALLRAAVPFMATIFGGYFISDVYNEKMAAKQAMTKTDYPAIIGNVVKKKADFWKFIAVSGIIAGTVIAFLTKKLK